MTKIIRRTRKQVIKRWVAALRSRKYKQTQGELHNSEGFCCLGVLCDLARKDGGDDWTVDDGFNRLYQDEVGALPGAMADFVSPGNRKILQHLAGLNDNDRTFREIAAVIEKELL
jgi:hypothetical protein